MATAGLVALFRSCMDGLKSILTTQEFGSEYELLCTELALQSLRIHLWGNSVGVHSLLANVKLTIFEVGIDVEASDDPHSFIINRQDLRPTFDRTVSSIAYLLKEVEELRRKYQLEQLTSIDGTFKDDSKTLRASKSKSTLSSFKSTLTLRQRMRENQKQKSFLAITKWAICDAKRFDEKVRKLKGLIDGLEAITKAAGLSQLETNRGQATLTLPDENPPRYSEIGPLSRTLNVPAERVELPPLPENVLPTYDTVQQASLWAVLKFIPIMKGFLSAYPDNSTVDRSRVQNKLLALSHKQFQELSEDVHDELIRRQRYEDPTPQWLLPKASFHPRRNEARKKLSSLVVFRFCQLVADVVFGFERRFPSLHGHVPLPHPDSLSPGTASPQLSSRRGPCSPSHPNVLSPPRPNSLSPDTTPPHPSLRWGLCPPDEPPQRLQHRPAHQSTNIDTASLTPLIRVPTSSFSVPRNFSRKHIQQPLYPLQPVTPQPPYISDSQARQWPMDNVVLWLARNEFSWEWQAAFRALKICGSLFLDLGNGHHSPGTFMVMHQQVYPRLAMEFAKSGNRWDEATERAEGSRMRRLIQNINPESTGAEAVPETARNSTTDIATNPSASVEIFKSFRVSMDDPTYKVLPAALKKYNINAPWEQYALYIVYGDNERCLEMDEKPLVLFKVLDKEGKKPMFMLRKIATTSPASMAASVASPVGNPPDGVV